MKAEIIGLIDSAGRDRGGLWRIVIQVQESCLQVAAALAASQAGDLVAKFQSEGMEAILLGVVIGPAGRDKFGSWTMALGISGPDRAKAAAISTMEGQLWRIEFSEPKAEADPLAMDEPDLGGDNED